MTITYTGKVANARLCAFSRLLLYWKGSIYKLVYKEMIIFCCLYALLSLVYRLALNEPQKRIFEKIALHCEAFANLIPLSFVLGFYVAICVTRWWNQYLNIPWPDRIMMYVGTMVDGVDERSRLIRRSIMRYLSLASLMVFQATSVSVKKRFPTMDHLLEAGVIQPSEVQALDEVDTPHGKWWVPFVWICNLIKEARKEGRIADDYLMKTLIDEVQTFRGHLGLLFSYDWISVPLVYTQVTTLAVYTFFLGCVFGRQFLDPKQNYMGHEVDLYIPVFTLLQFFFYMGWLKVAEQLINPFGEDDDDFEMNWIIDRNLQISLLVADDMYMALPKIEKDLYYGENPPESLPYTKSSINTIIKPHMGSTADLSVSSEGMKVVNPMETIQEGVAVETNNLYAQSPLPSPYTGRRPIPNVMSGIHSPGVQTPYNISKSTLDGLRVETKPAKMLTPGLSAMSRRVQSYIDSVMAPSDVEQGIRTGSPALGSSALSSSAHGASPLSLPREPGPYKGSMPIPIVSCSLPNQQQVNITFDDELATPDLQSAQTLTPGNLDAMSLSTEAEESEAAAAAGAAFVNLYPNPICNVTSETEDAVQDSEFTKEGRFEIYPIDESENEKKAGGIQVFLAEAAALEAKKMGRERHQSEQSASYSVTSSDASVNSFTPLLKAATRKEPESHT